MDNIATAIDLLKQAYMDNSWESVLDAINILEQEQEDIDDESEDY